MSMKSVCVGAALLGAACVPGQKDTGDPSSQGEPRALAVANTPVGAKRPVVLFVGTSLTAGYGLRPDQAYPSVVEETAAEAGLPIKAVNAGVSGETSAGALNRITWLLKQPADVIVIETGANDGLRALSVEAARKNIATIVDRVKRAKPRVPVVLVQMEAPRNLGEQYYAPFHEMYGEIARTKGVYLAPFLLDSVAGKPDLNQPDGVHPNAVGARIVASNIWKALEPVIRSLQERRRALS